MRISLLGNLLGYFTARQQGTVHVRGTASQTGSSARNDPARSILLSGVRAETARLGQGGRNALHAISMAEAADEGLARMASTLAEALVLAQQGASSGYTQAEQDNMQVELEALLDELDAIPASVDFDGTNLLTATSDVLVALAEATVDPSTELRIQTGDMSTQALGLVGNGPPTYATLTATSAYAVDDPSNNYMEGPRDDPPAELTFTFHGSEGDEVVTIYLEKNNSLTDVVDMINAETDALVPGWSAAEAVQVGAVWVLKVSTYEAGEAAAPDVAVSGELVWKTNDPVLPSHFTGQAGIAGTDSEPLGVTASDTVGKIEDAIDSVTGFRSNLAASIRRLAFASSAFESATDSSLAAESRINDSDTARATAASTRRELLGQGGIALLLQGNVTARTTLQLLGLPSAGDAQSFFTVWA